jgi:hypothetical protein
MKFHIEAKALIYLERNAHDKMSKHLETQISLAHSKNIPESEMYENGELSANAAKSLTVAFVQGLVCNIHNAHNNKTWDSAEHLRFIIKELERGFAAQVITTKHDQQ